MRFRGILASLLGDVIKIRVFSLLVKQGKGLTAKALSELAKTSAFKMHHVLKALVAQGVVTQTPMGQANVYRLNLDHILTQEIILPLLNFEETIFKRLGEKIFFPLKPKPLSILLYGSIARGEEKPDSDLDLFLVFTNLKQVSKAKEGSFMEEVTRKYGNPVMSQSITISDLKNRCRKRDPFLKNIFKEGIVIAGLSKGELLDYESKTNRRTNGS